MRPLSSTRIYSVSSILCYIYIASLLLGSSHQHSLFKAYLLTKLVLKKGPRLIPVPIPIKIPQEAKIVKVPVVHTSQHVHIHYHGNPPHPCEIPAQQQQQQQYGHSKAVHNELIKEGFLTLNHIDHGHTVQDAIDNRYGYSRNWRPLHDSTRIHQHRRPATWPPLGHPSSGTRQVLTWPQL